MMKQIIPKTVNIDLHQVDDNAFHIMGAFGRHAKRQGWTQVEVDTVIAEATAGDYDHMLAVIQAHCEPQNPEYHDA